jgi:protein disulfide-isomerase A6
VLISKDKKVPLLWKVLGNIYSDKIAFAATKTASAVDFVDEESSGNDKKSKVLVYAPGSTTPTIYDGTCCLTHL